MAAPPKKKSLGPISVSAEIAPGKLDPALIGVHAGGLDCRNIPLISGIGGNALRSFQELPTLSLDKTIARNELALSFMIFQRLAPNKCPFQITQILGPDLHIDAPASNRGQDLFIVL